MHTPRNPSRRAPYLHHLHIPIRDIQPPTNRLKFYKEIEFREREVNIQYHTLVLLPRAVTSITAALFSQFTGDVQVLRWNKKPNNLLEFKEGARVVWNQIESVGIPWSIVVLDARHLLLWNRGNGRPLQFTHSIGY
ncbi:hypothetical protein P8452_01794 [Trifolium repens]|nr:hypothetical protein P8452_01794 [Trifolium repens]